MANTLLVNTRKGSAVMAKIAGIESTAKIRSVDSITTRASARGVSSSVPGLARSTTSSGSVGRTG